ncbi:MAG TPA: THUMP domain-containing protein [Nitrososphaeraceae archaeon]|nr:THUMP domain-containing protein [Nitrososphaeraceae archaeon]
MKSNFGYNLCNWCLKRQYIKNNRLKKIVEDCEICHGVENQIYEITYKIIQATREYQYDTFLIGLTLDHSFYDNEDRFRSRFKIRGKQNIKASLLREIRKNFGKLSNKKIDLNSPDVTVNLQIGKKFETTVSVNSSTVILSGRYQKPKRFRSICNNSDNEDSLEINQRHIENILRKKLMTLFHSNSIIFWPIGKEEPVSLVLGNGRPFYVTIKNSKLISFKLGFSIRSNGLIFNIKERLPILPKATPVYIKKVRTLVTCEDSLKSSDLKLIDDSGIRIVESYNKRYKSWKFIYQMQSELKTQKKFELIILCDNRFPIRKFINGDENISPNLCQILDKRCTCEIYDILDIVSEDDLLN